MGNKSGFSKVILGVLGLHSGQGAGAYWWAEADPDVAALLRIYPDPDALREVARIIRGWAGEEPRALWERLRAERRARGATRGTVGEVAGWVVTGAWNYAQSDPRGEHRWAYVGPGRGRPGEGLSTTVLADRLAEVAGYLIEGAWAYRQGDPPSGGPVLPEDRRQSAVRDSDGVAALTGWRPTTAGNSGCADAFACLGWPSVRVSPRIPTAAEVSAAIGTPGDLSGCVVYADPPYAGTTGYTADLPRAEVVAHALDFADLGATVAISEAEAIPDLVRSGWHSVEITGGRVGQKRTWSKQSQEIITMNKQPQYTVPTQSSLFP